MLIKGVEELRAQIKLEREQGKTVGLVPTMGYLHEGHLSLIRAAKRDNDIVVVSIFVNPTQFAPNEDFDSYPRDLDRDIKLGESAGADIFFNPEVEEMYPQASSTFIEVQGGITQVLCGQSRPSHFRGVTTVVNMLFNIVQADRAYFGQKDAQQAAVLIQMVRDSHYPIEIVVCPIVREEDGLAMSSRNIYLNRDEREQAVVLNQALLRAKEEFGKGEKNVGKLSSLIQNSINKMPLADIDYVSIYSFPHLEVIEAVEDKAIAAVAVRFGKTRLIDNIIFE